MDSNPSIEIRLAIGGETDADRACVLNVRRSISIIEESLDIQREEENGLLVAGAVYRLEDGRVEFLRSEGTSE